MSEERVKNRWLVVVGALLIQLCLGAIYAWGTFTPTLQADKPKLVETMSPKLLELDADTATELALLKAAVKEVASKTTDGDSAESLDKNKKEAEENLKAFCTATVAKVPEQVWKGNIQSPSTMRITVWAAVEIKKEDDPCKVFRR